MLSKLHEAFPDFSWCSADRALFKAKMLFVWFVYLLFISLASGGHESPKRDYSVRRPHLGQLETWGGGRADPSRCHMPSTGLQRSRSACIRSCVPVLLLTQSDPGVVPQFHLLIRALGGRNCSIIQSWRLVQNGHQGPVLLGGQHESPGRVIPRGPWGCL